MVFCYSLSILKLLWWQIHFALPTISISDFNQLVMVIYEYRPGP